ncbi:hypothetical protein TCON_2077 [Astathelohania contejeani]|uniref:Sushi domain-containing protein n=1 Tax=Astathelohania contejeani TaxID=164912 RepID=A0ABQ7HX14_9MICR|nr:hypothetical protein TCON_2077 [Thelohania contejeani]
MIHSTRYYLIQIPLLMLVIFFLYYNCLYIIDRLNVHTFLRQSVKVGIEAEEIAFQERHEFINLEGWLNYNEYDEDDEIKEGNRQITTLNNTTNNNLICKGLILKVPSSHSHDPQICRKLGGRKCGRYLQKVVIPLSSANSNSNIDNINKMSNINSFYYWGGILIPGCTYCLWKEPEDKFCDPVWGYLQYSFEEDRWKCRSHLPGVYDAATNRLSACEPGGTLVRITNGQEEVVDLSQMKPQDFFLPIDEQKKYICRCSTGFIAKPDISRSTCFHDPCLAHLPPGVITAKGYTNGLCDCGPTYTNLHGNRKFPCTACPDPYFDKDTYELTIWIKCANGKNLDKEDKGTYPCLNFEDIERGCAKVILKANFIPKSDIKDYEHKENFFQRFIKFNH